MESVWEKDAPLSHPRTLEGNISTDVLIVGGGIAGLMCAYELKGAGVDCAVAEAARICGGITKNTTAKITFCHGLIYDRIIRRYGAERAKLYLEAQMRAEGRYAELCRDIECDYKESDSYVYSLDNRRKLENEAAALLALGVSAEISDTPELPMATVGAVRVRRGARFHPLKFLYAIAKDLPIFENTRVLSLGPHRAITNRGSIAFKKLIIATHFPILNRHGLYPLKLYQHRSYVISLKNAQRINGMYVDESGKGLSFREHGELLLLGGGAHKTGKRGGCWQELEDFAAGHYRDAEKVGKWATQDTMTLDGIPYIGRYSPSTPNVYVATGFNKWGMTNAAVAASILCDLVLERRNPYAEVFSPSRSILHPQLAVNAFESIIGLLTPTVPRCPHLGCALKYNRTEHSWDCPCHGSRFTEGGELIDNPATDDKKM